MATTESVGPSPRTRDPQDQADAAGQWRPGQSGLEPARWASPLRRAAALVVDALLVGVAWAVLTVAGVLLVSSRPPTTTTPPMWSAEGAIVAFLWMGVTTVLAGPLWWIYGTVMESRPRAATLGKRALGIRVVDRNGRSPSALSSAIRNAPKLLIPITVEALVAAWAGGTPSLGNPLVSLASIGLLVLAIFVGGTSLMGDRLVSLVPLVLVAIPALPLFVSERRRGLHDLLAGLAVVYAADDLPAGGELEFGVPRST